MTELMAIDRPRDGAPGVVASRPEQRFEAAASPIATGPEAERFYREALGEMHELGGPVLLAGTYAVSAYTGISRRTKDLDVFCKAGDYPRLLHHFQERGYSVATEDERWIGKVFKGQDFFDIIFASSNGTMPVTDQWFEDARRMELFDMPVSIIGPTELVWSKSFIQLRHRYDGPDVVHVILKQHDAIDWRRLLSYMELHWEVLLIHLLNFRWIYPSERDVIPRWLLDELLGRLGQQLDLPPPQTRICRGRMYSLVDYRIAVDEWGFADIGGEGAGHD